MDVHNELRLQLAEVDNPTQQSIARGMLRNRVHSSASFWNDLHQIYCGQEWRIYVNKTTL